MAHTGQKYPEYQSDIQTLGLKIDLNSLPKLKHINSQYRQESRKCHPDKSGGSKEDFQNLNKAFIRLSTFIAKLPNDDDDDENKDDEENVRLREFFQKFNDIKQNIASHTIFLENKFSDQWEEVLTNHYKKPVTKDSAIIWSLLLESKKVTVTLYKQPRSDGCSKLLIQSPGYYIFTAHQLPVLYKEVLDLSKPNLAISGTPQSNLSVTNTTDPDIKSPSPVKITTDILIDPVIEEVADTNNATPKTKTVLLSELINTGSPGWKRNSKSIRSPEHSTPKHIKTPTKQDQGSKAPSRDHPNSSFMTRLDYIRVED